MGSQGIDSREIRKEARRRGDSQRKVELDDFVLELPGLENNDISSIVPPRMVEQAESRILAKHKEVVHKRVNDDYGDNDIVQEEENVPDIEPIPVLKKKQKSKPKKVPTLSTGKMVKHSVFKEKHKLMKSRSIKLKYRRVPSNKAKLIYIDVISQMIKDYLREKEVVSQYIEKVTKEKKKSRGKKKNKSKESLGANVENNCQNIIRDYHDRINEYFCSLIDLRLSNGLIRNDIARMNMEKNQLRSEIFQIRQERNEIGLQMKQTRIELQKLNTEYSNREKLYRKLNFLKSGEIEDESVDTDAVMKDIKYKLNRIQDTKINESKLLGMIQEINKQLEAKVKEE